MIMCDVVLYIFAVVSIVSGAKISLEVFNIVCMAFGAGTLVGARFLSYLQRND